MIVTAGAADARNASYGALGWPSPRHVDDQMLRDGLLALRAAIGDPAQDVQLRHVAGRAAPRDLEDDGAIAIDGPLRPVSRVARDIDQVELLEPAIAHIVG